MLAKHNHTFFAVRLEYHYMSLPRSLWVGLAFS
jgi:hypothetical protein